MQMDVLIIQSGNCIKKVVLLVMKLQMLTGRKNVELNGKS